jgi:RHS repeat-associated protein
LRQSKNGATHLWDGANIIADITDYSLTKYVRGVNLLYSETNNERSYYLYNAHGDVVQLTDEYGDVTKYYDYDAFGVERDASESDVNPFRYCGEYYDEETQTYYLRARYYSPATGRFTSEDPIRDGLNWYTYANNNPIFFIDPSGLAVTAWDMQNLSPSQVAELASLTDQWNSATSQAQRDAAHAQANAIRQSAGTGVTFNANGTANAYGGDAIVFYGAVTGGGSVMPPNQKAGYPVKGTSPGAAGSSYPDYSYESEQSGKAITAWYYSMYWDQQFFLMNYFDILADLFTPEADTTGWGRSIGGDSLPEGTIPATFPNDPNDFNPPGLIPNTLPGSNNGGFIQWKDSQGRIIYQWDEDWKKGSHYHYYPGGIKEEDTHYYPGTPIPK